MDTLEFATHVASNKEKVISLLSSIGALPINERLLLKMGPTLEYVDNEDQSKNEDGSINEDYIPSYACIYSLKFDVRTFPNVYESETILLDNVNDVSNFLSSQNVTPFELDALHHALCNC